MISARRAVRTRANEVAAEAAAEVVEDGVAVGLLHLRVDEQAGVACRQRTTHRMWHGHTTHGTGSQTWQCSVGAVRARTRLGDLLGEQLDAVHRVAENDGLVDLELREMSERTRQNRDGKEEGRGRKRWNEREAKWRYHQS